MRGFFVLLAVPAIVLGGEREFLVASGVLVRFRDPIEITNQLPRVLTAESFRQQVQSVDDSAPYFLIGQVRFEKNTLICFYRDGFRFGTAVLSGASNAVAKTLSSRRQACMAIHSLRVSVSRSIGGPADDFSDNYMHDLRSASRVYFSNSERQGTVVAEGSEEDKKIIVEYLGNNGCIEGNKKVFDVQQNGWATLVAVASALSREDRPACPLRGMIDHDVTHYAGELSVH